MCPNSYEIQAKSGSRTFTNAAQILAAFGLEVVFEYPTSGLVVGRSGFACDWRRPRNRGKPRRDFSVRYCCGNLIFVHTYSSFSSVLSNPDFHIK